MNIRPLDNAYRPSVNAYVRYLWGGPMIVSRGAMYDSSGLPGFVAEAEGALLGASLYRTLGDECEVCALFSLVQRRGVGACLMDGVAAAARQSGARRLWLITTNDDTQAIRFYQRYGMTLAALRLNALDETRRQKGELPALGEDGILILHELEFHLAL